MCGKAGIIGAIDEIGGSAVCEKEVVVFNLIEGCVDSSTLVPPPMRGALCGGDLITRLGGGATVIGICPWNVGLPIDMNVIGFSVLVLAVKFWFTETVICCGDG